MGSLRAACIALAVLFCAAGGAAIEYAHAAEDKQPAPPFSCSAAEIYGGQHTTGAIIDLTQGNPNPLRFFRINEGRSGLEVIAPLDSAFLAEYAAVSQQIWPHRLPFRFYWSVSGTFVAWVAHRLWISPGDSIATDPRPRFEHVVHHLKVYHYSLDDVIPEHIENTARQVGHDMYRYLLEFNVRSGIFRQLPISVGPHPFGGLAWTSNDAFLRIRPHILKDNRYLDIFDATAREWVEFSPQRLPLDSKVLMFRLNPRDKKPEAMISWRDRGNADHVGSITRGAAAPKLLDSGQFARIHVSPDRTQLMGVTEESGRFHRLKGEPYSPRVSFWLARFEKMSGIEKFYLQDNAKYAFIKVSDPTAGTEIAVWERKGDEVQRVGTICSTK
jgi:hypothetical protein